MKNTVEPVLVTPSKTKSLWQAWWWLGLLLLFGLDIGLVYFFQTSRRISAGDFFIPWFATREIVFNGRDPYSAAVTEAIQIAMSGVPFGPEVADPLSFNYPLYFSLYLLPLIWLDYPLAEAIWNVINQFALAGTVWVLLRLVGWNSPKVLHSQLPYLAAYLAYPFLYTIAYGQYTVITLFLAASGALLLQRRHYGPGGVLVALAVFKPQTGALLVALLLWWCLLEWKERYPALLGGLATGLLLLLIPMGWQADWLLRWLNQAAVRRTRPGMYSYNEETLHLLGLSRPDSLAVGSLVALAMGAVLVWLWVRRRRQSRQLPGLFGLTALLTLSLLPQYGYCNDILFYPAAILLLDWLRQRKSLRLLVLISLGVAVGLYVPLLAAPGLVRLGWVVCGAGWLGWEVAGEIRRKPHREDPSATPP